MTAGADALPNGWCWTTVEALGGVSGGLTKNAKRSGYPIELPYLRVANVYSNALDLDDVQKIGLRESEKQKALLKRGDLLVVEGNGSIEQIGRVALWDGSIEPCVHQNHIIKVRLSPSVAPEWVLFWLLSPRGRDNIVRVASSTSGLYTLSLGKVSRMAVPLAPAAEQRRVVGALETELTRLDAAASGLSRVRILLERYRTAVLKSAVAGRLVPTEAELARQEGREYEPASELAARTARPPRPSRFRSRSKDVVEGHSALAVGNPGSPLPEGWAWVDLLDIAQLESGHTPSRRHPEWWGGEVPWIGIKDARAHHGGVIRETIQHTNEQGLANSAARLLPAGTVCLSRTASVGYVIVMGRPMATSQDFVNWICTEAIQPKWLQYVLMADREALLRFGKGTTHTTIYFPEVLSLHVALPPLAEQRRIVAEVDRQMSTADAMEASLGVQKEHIKQLRRGILSWAFEGRLVDQDTSDEPASDLLAQIVAAREHHRRAGRRGRA